MDTKQVVDLVGASIELAGIVVLVTGAVLAFLLAIKTLFYKRDTSVAYRVLRRGLGKAILIGLELLVAADIIRSVAISPSFATIGVLGMIVVIRTFLSWSLELEINGSWPWQGSRSSDDVESRHF